MPCRIIPAIIILALIIPPISGSTGKPASAAPAVFGTIEVSHQIQPALAEEPPPPENKSPETLIVVSTPVHEESLPLLQENATPVPDEPSSAAPAGEIPSEVIPVETSPPGEIPSADDPAEEPQIIFDTFPTADLKTWEYTVFKNEVMAIINKAERSSGIKTVYGVFVMDLTNNYICGVNENLTRVDPDDNMEEGYFNSASVIKLFQGYILCDMMRRGELSMEETYYDPVTGRRFKLLKMIRDMISYSDNNYSNASLRLIGNQKSNEVLDRLGIHNSRIYGEMSGAIGYSRKNNLEKYGTVKRCARITPRDTGLILYNVYINQETDIYMETIHKGLLGNIYNTRIPVGVARVNPKYAIAHKTGTNSQLGIYNDAGIIYCKRPFILVVFTQSTTSKAGQNFIRSLAEQLTRYFDSKA